MEAGAGFLHLRVAVDMKCLSPTTELIFAVMCSFLVVCSLSQDCCFVDLTMCNVAGVCVIYREETSRFCCFVQDKNCLSIRMDTLIYGGGVGLAA